MVAGSGEVVIVTSWSGARGGNVGSALGSAEMVAWEGAGEAISEVVDFVLAAVNCMII